MPIRRAIQVAESTASHRVRPSSYYRRSRLSYFKLPASPLAIALTAMTPALAQTLPASQERSATDVPAVALRGALDKIIVTASRVEQRVDDLAASFEVLDATRLEREQIGDIRDIAREMPNVSVNREPARFTLAGASTGRQNNEGFSIRGIDGNRVLMMVDGVRVPRSYAFGAVGFGRDYVDATLLKRVEVLKGPASVLYGSDGLGGAVNLITVEPRDYLKASESWGGKVAVSFSGDDSNTKTSATAAAAVSDAHQWLITLSGDRGKELSNQGVHVVSNSDRTAPNPQTNHGEAVLAKWVWRQSASWSHHATLELVHKRSRYDLLTSITPLPLSGSLPATAVVFSRATFDARRERISLQSKGEVRWAVADRVQISFAHQSAASREYTFEDRNTASDRARDVFYWEKLDQLGLQFDKTVQGKDLVQRWTYGFDLVRTGVRNLNDGVVPPLGETFPLKRFPDTTETTRAVYVQNRIRSGAWEFVPALRWDRFSIDASQVGFSPPSTTPAASLSGSALSPKFSVLWRAAPGVRVWTHVASGFRAPSAHQINAFFESLTSFYKTIPNPALKPEHSRAAELGVRGALGSLDLEAAAFHSIYRDLISDSQLVAGSGVAGNPSVFQSVNIGKARISGIEIRGGWEFARAWGGDFKANWSHGQLRGRDLMRHLPLDQLEPARTQLGLAWRSDRGGVKVMHTHHAAKKADEVSAAGVFLTPSASTWDMSADWRLTTNTRLVMSIQNFTNEKYWLWNSARGLAVTSPVLDAFTQAGRHVNLSIVSSF